MNVNQMISKAKFSDLVVGGMTVSADKIRTVIQVLAHKASRDGVILLGDYGEMQMASRLSPDNFGICINALLIAGFIEIKTIGTSPAYQINIRKLREMEI